eukprot:Plantae.Rhodophyta-Purpureofilum_apyrenoidigerum.ctg2746.p1 GENE.Plantae.Rhodophyta-Purpureofilum_apyrenoidigerum.ctg2746~~Plantae.Rhodophyta-Purpureofilum_apyrenoidigerum.ctg2746.p1  ORF type:complete len:120 (+),score=21.81 Plantae.Rhodophyta-Purpureofilum_apyrenoidigerum.ctg2746:144-503(+)
MSSLAKYIINLPGIRTVVSKFQGFYISVVDKECRKFGLYYDDLLNEYLDDHKRALEMLPEEEKVMREKRIRRAMDLQLKKTYLHPDLQKDVNVWHPYIRSRLPLVRKQILEEEAYKRLQ